MTTWAVIGKKKRSACDGVEEHRYPQCGALHKGEGGTQWDVKLFPSTEKLQQVFIDLECVCFADLTAATLTSD